MWTCTNDHWVCERLHGFYYGCTASFIRLAVNNGYLKFGVVGDSVTVSYCTVYSHDSTASTVDFEDDCAHSNLLVKTVYFTICLKYWVWKYHRTNLVYGYHRVTLTGQCIALIPVVGYSNAWRPGGRTLQAAGEKVLVRYKTCSIIPPVAVVTFYQTLLETIFANNKIDKFFSWNFPGYNFFLRMTSKLSADRLACIEWCQPYLMTLLLKRLYNRVYQFHVTLKRSIVSG